MAYTGIASSNAAATAAFEKAAYFQLRSHPMLESICDVKSTNQSHQGASVQFNIYNDLSKPTTANVLTELHETTDVTAVALSDTVVTIAMKEYGNAIITTAKLHGQSFMNVDADAANIVGYNMVDSIDLLVHAEVTAGSNVAFGNSAASKAALVAADTLKADDVRAQVAALRGASVMPHGSAYTAFIHPDVSYDFRSDTAVTDIVQYQIRQDGQGVRQGSIGTFGGAEFIETPRLGIGMDAGSALWTDAGASNVDAYPTVICGKQALGKVFSRASGFGENPSIVHGPVTDTLRRLQPIGWYHMVGYGRFREASLRRIESASSIGAN